MSDYKFTRPTVDKWVEGFGHVRSCIDCEQLIVGGMARCVRCCVEGPPRERVSKAAHQVTYQCLMMLVHFPVVVVMMIALYSHVHAPAWLWALGIFEKALWFFVMGFLFASSRIKDKDHFDLSDQHPIEETSAADVQA